MLRKVVFSIVPTLVLLVALEGMLRIFPDTHHQDPVARVSGLKMGDAYDTPYVVLDLQGEKWVPHRDEMSRYTELPVQITPGRLRAAAFGGSTMATARPNGPAWQFAALLSLGTAGRSDFINLGANGYGTSRIRGAVAEMSQHKLAVVFLYTGHNEYVEHRWVLGSMTMWQHRAGQLLRNSWHTYSWLQSIKGSLHEDEFEQMKPVQERHLLQAEESMLLSRLRQNLEAIAESISRGGAHAVWVLPASNLSARPEGSSSYRSLSQERTDQLRKQTRAALGMLERGAFSAAARIADQCLRAAPDFAMAWYIKGMASRHGGDQADALSSLRRARDFDRVPRRATTRQRGVIAEVARRHGFALVDAEQILLDSDPGGYIRGDYSPDRMHLKSDAYRLVAMSAYGALRSKVKGLSPLKEILPKMPGVGESLDPVLGPRQRTVFVPEFERHH